MNERGAGVNGSVRRRRKRTSERGKSEEERDNSSQPV